MSISNGGDDDEERRILKINIFDIDFYTTKPTFLHDKTYSIYRQLNTPTASVIRIFGSTDNGIKLCLHLHQYFPHLSVRLIDLAVLCGIVNHENDAIDFKELPDDLLLSFIVDLECSMKGSLKTFRFDDQADCYNDGEHYVYSVEVVEMLPVYGYHERKEFFVQFNFYANWMAEAAKTTLQRGFMNYNPVIVYNHLEYLLQFYVDNQIYLNALYLNEITVRKQRKPDSNDNNEVLSNVHTPLDDDERFLSLPIKFEYNQLRRTSSCYLECDTNVSNLIRIIRQQNYSRDLFFNPSLPGIINLWNDHFARATKKDKDFRSIVSFLDNKVKRNYSTSDTMNHFFKTVIRSYICSKTNESSPSFNESFTPTSSGKRLENDAILDNLEEEYFDFEEFVNEIGGDGEDGENFDDEDMALTQEQLRLKYSFEFDSKLCKASHFDFEPENEDKDDEDEDFNKSLYDLEISDEIEDYEEPQYKNDNEEKIPQVDGNFDDSSESDNDSKIQSPLDDLNPENDSDLVLDFNISTVQHSTPLQQTRKGPKKSTERSKSRLKTSLKRFRDSFNFETIEENNISTKFRKTFSGNKERQFFVQNEPSSSTQSIPSPCFDYELDSIISNTSTNHSSLFDGFTIEFDINERHTNPALNDYFQLTLISMELHCITCKNLLPDPAKNKIEMIMFSLYHEVINSSESSFQLDINDDDNCENLRFALIKALIVDKRKRLNSKEILRINNKNIQVQYVGNEEQLLRMFSFHVQYYDPDIVSGYITDSMSWGYLLQRCKALGLHELVPAYSRIFSKFHSKNTVGDINKQPELNGRIILNVWYLMRKEITLRCYTFENVCLNLFNETVCKLPNETVNNLWQNSVRKSDELSRDRVLEYYLIRVVNQVKMLVKTHLIRRTYDLSCLFGMKFEDVLKRGTQYRVESMLLPLAKLENFIPIRFTRNIVDEQNSAEEIPLVMEPQISFHSEPVSVLDFQSLYPSVMIAHNYCFTTCLGKVKNIVRSNGILGCHRLFTGMDVLEKIKDDIDIAPNGSVFVKPNVRRGLLSKMLQDLLYTRILIKNELKEAKAQLAKKTLSSKLKKEIKELEKKLDNCQLGLKLIANVTYGYTSANMSGRMPCVDLADAIVSKGREALEKAILFINRWGQTSGTRAKVIYGDTDSVFISFPGCSVEKAFEYSDIIAKEITAMNPFPMMIKVEKVYSPCILFAKKRYCGKAYEGPKKKPFFDAKGIETVRRDNCPVVSKMLRKCIDLLFDNHGNVEQLKPYLQWQMKKIINGRISNLTDFIFAKEFWGLEFYTNTAVMPSAIIAQQWIDNDPRAVPKTKQRIPYVIVAGSPKSRLADLVRDPRLFLEQSGLRINSSYYIQRAIFPPLIRVLEAFPEFDSSLLMKWYEEVRFFKSKKVKIMSIEPGFAGSSTGKIGAQEYFPVQICTLCGLKCGSQSKLCDKCQAKPQKSLVAMFNRLQLADEHLKRFESECSKCQRTVISRNNNRCSTLDCSKLYQFHQANKDFEFVSRINMKLEKHLHF